MSGAQAGASTRTSRVIKARPEDLYDAFVDPKALVEWLPPADAEALREGTSRGPLRA